MKDHFTVYGSGKVNLNTADAETLRLLGLEEAIGRRMTETRKGEDGILGTEDDLVFKAVPDLVSPEVVRLLELDQDQQLALSNFLSARQGMLTVQSTVFKVHVEGKMRQGKVRKQIVAVVDRERNIRYWHED